MKSFEIKVGIFIIIIGAAVTFMSKFLSPLFSFLLGLIGILFLVSGMLLLFIAQNKN